jgi:hypothetical protein
MKKMIFAFSVFFLLCTVASPGISQADIVDAPSSDFQPTAIFNLPNLLLQNLGSDDPIPLDYDLGSTSCGIGNVSAEISGDFYLQDPAYAVWFEPTQGDDLIVKASTQGLDMRNGDLILHFNGCLFLTFDLTIPLFDISADMVDIHYQADTLYNTETDKVVLDTVASQLLILECLEWSGDECLNWSLNMEMGGNWPGELDAVKDLIEGWITSMICTSMGEDLGEEGDLATTEDGGMLHDLMEMLLDPFYKRAPSWAAGTPADAAVYGSDAVTESRIFSQIVGFAIIPVAFIAGLVFWNRRRRK